MPNAIRNPPRRIFHKSRPVQFHPVMAGIVKQQTRNLRHHTPKSFRMLRRPRRKSRKRSRQQQPSVSSIHKRFNLPQSPRQSARRQRPTQRKQTLQQQRRNNRAIFHRTKRRRIRAKISNSQLRPAIRCSFRSCRPVVARNFERPHLPLRPVAVSPRLRPVRHNLPGPLDLPDPPQGLAQNLTLEFQLRLITNVLVVAPTANAKVPTPRLNPLRRRRQNPFHPPPHKFLLLLHSLHSHALRRQHKWHKNRRPIVMSQPLPAVNQFFNRNVQTNSPHLSRPSAARPAKISPTWKSLCRGTKFPVGFSSH